jgi:uncharacterized protein with ParB-like and HNH nuclease domain
MDNITLLTIEDLINGKIELKLIDSYTEKKEVVIKEKSMPFFVDSYQRGYKWGAKEICDLLDDIDKFESSDISKFYCLQPLVIKKVNDKYELIDGQQRCTTLFLILNFLEMETFKIEYKVRESSQRFLEDKHFKKPWEESKKEFDNIDNFHFSQAYEYIREWFSTKDEGFKNNFVDKLLNHVKVIWYEVNADESSQQIFKKINVGKIPLTNADLVKALLAINCEDIVLKQWNEVDLKLKNDKFWWFISNSEYNSRIDYLLEIVTQTLNKQDRLSSFLYFEKHSNKNKLWDKTFQTFLKLVDFEEDIEMYHKLGFAVWRLNYSLESIYQKGRFTILEEIEKEIEKLKIGLYNKIPNKKLVNASFHYGQDHVSVYNLWSLHNIETHYSICTNQYYNPFPFKEFKNTSWSLEHISPQNIESLKQNELLDFAKNLKELKIIDEDFILDSISKLENNSLNVNDFSIIQGDFVKKLKANNVELISEDEKHSVVNLCLIDKNLNSSLGNHFLHHKKEKINNSTCFVPICSVQIFNKHFTPKPTEFSFWNNCDRKNYAEKLLNIISPTTHDK